MMIHAASSASRAATVPFPSPSIDASFRPARALLGWMTAEEAHEALAMGHDAGVTATMTERAAKSRSAVTLRRLYRITTAVTAPPTGVGDHLSRFRTAFGDLFNEGWRLATIDLRQVVALQPRTFADHYAEQTFGLASSDIGKIIRLTLPLPVEAPPLVQHPSDSVWLVSSNDPHFHIAEAAHDPAEGVLGFRLGRATSVMRVAELDGRLICQDGHHRALQLLRRSIALVPALLKSFSSFPEIAVAPGLFSEEVCMGDRPPTLADLLDNEVAADVLAPATRKFLLIEAREFVLPV
jgi:hypothetical protein